MNEREIPEMVLNMKVKYKHPRGRPISWWEQCIRKMSHWEGRRWEEIEEELQEARAGGT
jgi:hypothetical protein